MNTRDSAFSDPATAPIADTQSMADHRRIAIDRVGIKAIRHPVRIAERPDAQGTAGVQHTVATFDMAVGLPQEFKGTHMSRFVAILNAHEREITVESFRAMLGEMVERLGAASGRIEMRFPYFVDKAAPVTGVRSLIDYEVTFVGEISDGAARLRQTVLVPVTSLCPCSKEISERGAHNQRSHVTVTAESRELVWIEDIIDLVEAQASSQLYGLLKRPDEKFVTERAYDNPKFVEDMVRDVAAALNADSRIRAYRVEAENFESIHNHSAYAVIERGA
ncbi:MAG: GTP cyclohydrolase I FolE2 [Burkholderiales bacterium]|nr:GTP cyclohydrolase I FolE2 [Burkholderiales bacterium]